MVEGDDPPAVRLTYGDRVFTVVKGRVPLRVGRHQENDLVLRDSLVSRFHATVRWDADAPHPQLYDNGSQNGTTLNGEPVRGRAVVLSDGDRVQIGSARFDVELEGAEDEAAPALIERTSDSVTLFTDGGPEFNGVFDEGRRLHDVLQQLEVEQRSGTLRVELTKPQAGISQGQVTVCLGRLMAATWGDLSSGRALEALLSRQDLASYNFTRELEPTEFPLNMWYSDFLRLRNAEGQVTRQWSSEVSAALRNAARDDRRK
ncbi:MAG: FHA domain-containing protein [Planctomycetota bacterium]